MTQPDNAVGLLHSVVCICYIAWKVLFNTSRCFFLFGTPLTLSISSFPKFPTLQAQHSGQGLMESFRRAAGRWCGLVLIDLIQPTETSISHSTQWDRNYCSTPLDHQLMRRGIFLCEGFSRNAALKMREWGTMNGEILERKAAPGIEGFLSRGRHYWTMASKVFCGQKFLPAFLTHLDFSSIKNKKSKVRS